MRTGTDSCKAILTKADTHHPRRAGMPATISLVSNDIAYMVTASAHHQADDHDEGKSNNGEVHSHFRHPVNLPDRHQVNGKH